VCYTGRVSHEAPAYLALREKYLEMHRLRRAHVAGEDGDPRPALRDLAARFPGALREIDRIPLEEIELRIVALEAVVAGEAEAPVWARYAVSYHGTMRAVLRIKRLSLGCATLDEALARVGASYVAAHDEPPLERFDAPTLARIVRPQRGRLNPFVLAEVARAHISTVEEIERALFF
jgi:hypothetical protein